MDWANASVHAPPGISGTSREAALGEVVPVVFLHPLQLCRRYQLTGIGQRLNQRFSSDMRKDYGGKLRKGV